ncbi:MAG: hypothetical protein J2P51_16855, partial [Hyphomicrobiaceae bacterium]|nr:hypothetical protein [Hyphomicrobiaceae bacterium]
VRQQRAPHESTCLAVRLMRPPIGTVKRRVPRSERSQARRAVLAPRIGRVPAGSHDTRLRPSALLGL